MKDNRLLQFFKKYWLIGVLVLLALGAVFSSVEIYKEEVQSYQKKRQGNGYLRKPEAQAETRLILS